MVPATLGLDKGGPSKATGSKEKAAAVGGHTHTHQEDDNTEKKEEKMKRYHMKNKTRCCEEKQEPVTR